MSACKFLGNFARRFSRDRRGSLIPYFALAVVPIATLIGAGVDYGRMSRAQSQLVSTIDAAVLAAQLQLSLDENADYEQIIVNYVAKNLKEAEKPLFFKDIEAKNIDLSEEGELSADITAEIPLFFMSLAGVAEHSMKAHAAAMVGGSALELALVLDNTGSMQGDKIAALKEAAEDLVDTIMPQNQADKVKIAVVPFADYVNIGKDNRDEDGLDIPEDYDFQPAGEDCDVSYPNSNQQCTCQGGYKETCNDGVCTTAWNNCATQTCTGSKGDPVYSNCKPKKKQTYKWHGCMASRPYSPSKLSTKDSDYDTQGVPGAMDTSDWCKNIAPVQRLTDNKGQVTAALAKMKSQRNTYIPSGLIWGWRAVSNAAPFADGTPDSSGVKKAIVLMTDGANTIYATKKTGAAVQEHEGDVYWHTNANNATKVATANTVTAELCTNIKAAGIMVYTIGFDLDADEEGDGSNATKTMLQACAGNGGQYFDADDEVGLADAFTKIGQSLLNLRLSK